MANFTFNATAGLSTSDGISLSRALTGLNANAKALLDDTFGPGPLAVDLAPLIASIADPLWALMLAEGDGARLKFDGGAFSIKSYKTMLVQMASTPSGVLDLELEALGVSQRIRFLAIGD
jgi:hypothetical protein